MYLCIGGASGRLMVFEPELAGSGDVYSGGAALNCTTLLLLLFWSENFLFVITFMMRGWGGLNLGRCAGFGPLTDVYVGAEVHGPGPLFAGVLS